MPTRTFKSSSPSAGLNPAIAQPQEMSPDLLRQLSELGIDPGSVYLETASTPFVGISSASGPAEFQDEIDAWVDGGGIPEFEQVPAPTDRNTKT